MESAQTNDHDPNARQPLHVQEVADDDAGFYNCDTEMGVPAQCRTGRHSYLENEQSEENEDHRRQSNSSFPTATKQNEDRHENHRGTAQMETDVSRQRTDEVSRSPSAGESVDVGTESMCQKCRCAVERTTLAARLHHHSVQQDPSYSPPLQSKALDNEWNNLGVPLAKTESSASAVPNLEGACIADQHSSIETNVPNAVGNQSQTLFGGSGVAPPPLPVFTSREEEIEFASQPVEEIVAAEADVLGLTADMANKARIVDDDDLDAALLRLEAELALLPDCDKAAYAEVTQRCPDLVDAEHKRAFLWREEYDAKLAAKRLVRYWERRRALFGEKCWCLPLTIAGALKHDTAALQSCLIRALPVKDERGRAVFDMVFRRYDPTSTRISAESMIRACWYTFHVVSEDPTVRERGFVLLERPEAEDDAKWMRKFLWAYTKVVKTIFELEAEVLPIVFRSLHWCKPSDFFHLVAPVLKYVIGKRLRGRFKVHYGSEDEVLKGLEECGMTRNCLPRQLGGNVVTCHDQWIADHSTKECGTDCVLTAASASRALPSCPVSIEGNDEAWEPIRIGTKNTSFLDSREEHLHTSAQFDREATSRLDELESRLDELESTTSIKRKSNRQRQICDLQYGESAVHKPIAVSTKGLGLNETQIAENAVPNDGKKRGRKGDPRMNKALKAKLADPELSAEDSLLAGGFVFPNTSPFLADKDVLDTDNVSLAQRKSQFRRRLREENRKSNDVA